MTLTLVTEPDGEPVTLEQIKSQTRLDIDDDDLWLRARIKAARQWVEGQTRRCFKQATYDHVIDWDWPYFMGCPRIDLPLNPVQSVTSITYVDGSSPNPTLAASQYTVAARTYGSFIVPAYGVTWPSVRDVPAAITVRFVAGDNDEIPEPIVAAMAMLIAHWYENRQAVEAKEMVPVPYGIESLLSPYRAGRML